MNQALLAELNKQLIAAGHVPYSERPVQIPSSRRGYPLSSRITEFVKEARNWPQPMQDDLLPLLQANGFKTEAQQAENMRKAVLRAAARSEMLTPEQRKQYAKDYDLPNAIRAVWWLRRHTAKTAYNG